MKGDYHVFDATYKAPMKSIIELKQVNNEGLTVHIPLDMAEHEISHIMGYKTRLNYPTYVARFRAEPPTRYNEAIKQLHSKYGV